MLAAVSIVPLAAVVAVVVPAPVNAWAGLLEQHGAILVEQQVQFLCQQLQLLCYQVRFRWAASRTAFVAFIAGHTAVATRGGIRGQAGTIPREVLWVLVGVRDKRCGMPVWILEVDDTR